MTTVQRVGSPEPPTIWGLTPVQIHDRFWASRGVQCVRPGEPSEIVESAELFLLLDAGSLVGFPLRMLVETLSWLTPRLLVLRLRDEGRRDYEERVRCEADGSFLGFERLYPGLDSRQARVGLTPYRDVAQEWQASGSAVEGWRRLRASVPRDARLARSQVGGVFDATDGEELSRYLEYLMAKWSRPDSTIPRVDRGPRGAWLDQEASAASDATVVGKVWVGAGRSIDSDDLVIGPAILWDEPETRPGTDSVPWLDLEPLRITGGLRLQRRHVPAHRRWGKRAFDIVFSMLALAVTLPLYPFIALAILIEDGWPVFFAHQRETLGGRQFPCLKFRSMRRDAEQIKRQLAAENVADGPQFFLKNDPRSTRVGRFLRATQLDELPQFLNVLAGHMSVVGPRPSPRRENQFCPAWRDARLSVRPGITGLWQVRRTRTEGLDFQEWIRFDLEYVERMSWALDLSIILRTLGVVLGRGGGK